MWFFVFLFLGSALASPSEVQFQNLSAFSWTLNCDGKVMITIIESYNLTNMEDPNIPDWAWRCIPVSMEEQDRIKRASGTKPRRTGSGSGSGSNKDNGSTNSGVSGSADSNGSSSRRQRAKENGKVFLENLANNLPTMGNRLSTAIVNITL